MKTHALKNQPVYTSIATQTQPRAQLSTKGKRLVHRLTLLQHL